MKKAAQKVVTNTNKITDFFSSTKSPKKASESTKMQIEEEEEKIAENKPKAQIPTDGSLLPLDDFISELYSWKPKLQSFTDSQKFKNIYTFIKKEYETKTIYPPANLIFNAFKLTPINKIKVVIVGQDPYIKKNQAMGLSFSVPKGTNPPPSLVNIYKCIEGDKKITGFKRPKHGDLTKWCVQGVFLLNNLLTVQADKSDSHKGCGWADFTDKVIEVINNECDKIIFLLWGLPAQKKAKIVNRSKHVVLESSHPSPLSASRGFLTCGHFSKVNEILKQNGKEEIDWNLD